MSDLTTLTGQLASMKQRMIDRLTAQGVSGYTMQDTMDDIVTAYNRLQTLNYQTTTITENGSYVSDPAYTGYNNFIVNVPTGGPVSHKKYNLLERVREDIQGDTIGTVVGFHYDANNVEYAIVCLDAVYRLTQGEYQSSNTAINQLVGYGDSTVFNAKETATYNCDKIMEWVNAATGRSSLAVEHCRSKSFIIGGNTYNGQLPTLIEALKILEWRTEVNTLDLTANDNPTLVIGNNGNMWTSTQSTAYSKTYAWFINGGETHSINKTFNNCYIIPILEIPNAVIPE